MGNRVAVHIHESCAIPYRLTRLGVEFCLVSEVKANRWEFPRMPVMGEFSPRALLEKVAATAGAAGELEGEQPLSQFVAARGGEPCCTSAYLMHVTIIVDQWPEQAGRRRLWCLAEEARVRLRRKPLRRLIDIALHALAPRSASTPVGNGHSSATK